MYILAQMKGNINKISLWSREVDKEKSNTVWVTEIFSWMKSNL